MWRVTSYITAVWGLVLLSYSPSLCSDVLCCPALPGSCGLNCWGRRKGNDGSTVQGYVSVGVSCVSSITLPALVFFFWLQVWRTCAPPAPSQYSQSRLKRHNNKAHHVCYIFKRKYLFTIGNTGMLWGQGRLVEWESHLESPSGATVSFWVTAILNHSWAAKLHLNFLPLSL